MFSKPIKYDTLEGTIITKNHEMKNTDEFNEAVMKDLKLKVKDLHWPSVLGIKKLVKENYVRDLKQANSVEVNDAIKYWVKGIPQRSFKQLSQKQRRHKL